MSQEGKLTQFYVVRTSINILAQAFTQPTDLPEKTRK
jgi:hypothetical protein